MFDSSYVDRVTRSLNEILDKPTSHENYLSHLIRFTRILKAIQNSIQKDLGLFATSESEGTQSDIFQIIQELSELNEENILDLGTSVDDFEYLNIYNKTLPEFKSLIIELDYLLRELSKTKFEPKKLEFEASIGSVKVIADFTETLVGKANVNERAPELFSSYISYISDALSLIKAKKLQRSFEGTKIFIRPSLKVDNMQYFGGYESRSDSIIIYSEPTSYVTYIVVHEYGHRFEMKFLNERQRSNFDAFFKIPPRKLESEDYEEVSIQKEFVEPASEYGHTNPLEDFAEVFAHYVFNRNLTEVQKIRFERIVSGKDFRIGRRLIDLIKLSKIFR